MAFTFTVETGAGVTGANSYVSVADADDILVVDVHNFATWDAYTDTKKEHLLAWATRMLDDYVQWYGDKSDDDNPLRWPREGVCDRDGVEIDDDVVPEAVKQATAVLAMRMGLQDRTGEQGRDGVRRVRADVVEVELDEDYRIGTIPDDIAFMLEGLGIVNTGASIGFGRISRA